MAQTETKTATLALDLLKRTEGFKGYLYDDKTGHRVGRLPSGGWPTVGYGFNLAAWPLTEEESAYILSSRIFGLSVALSKKIPSFLGLSQKRQAVLISIAYNAGIDGLLGFEKMLRKLKQFDYAGAADEIVNSDAGRDPLTAKRYKELSEWMISG